MNVEENTSDSPIDFKCERLEALKKDRKES
jgi:hypothetical protein